MKKKHIILGFGISGRSCAELLLNEKKNILALDQRAIELHQDPNVLKLLNLGVLLQSDQTQINWNEIQQLIISPGISPNHSIVNQAKENGIEVIGEIEFAFRRLKNRCVGVTGTNGKTTVVLLIQHILKSANIPAVALGNIGTTLSSYILEGIAKLQLGSKFAPPSLNSNPEEILVVELSSFQLETMHQTCLDAALILNITPDHLDRYPSFEEYAKAKCQIENCLKPNANLWISRQVQQEFGYLLKNAKLFEETSSCKPSIATISPMRYIQLGVPERQNIQAAYSICCQLGVSDELFWRGLETFRKPKHRIEFVLEWNGMTFYNDSKATNIDSVMHAVGLFSQPIVLLAGGVHKGASYHPWIQSFNGKVQKIVAFGQAAPKMEEDLKDNIPVIRVETLQEAILQAVQCAEAISKCTILLSPGCSSYDQFRNYEHRGNEFKRIVEEKIWIERKRS